MRTNQIEMYLYAIKTGSIAEAARKLGKSRTTVSAALSALEDELGIALLNRTGNQIIPTDIGDAIANDFERMLLIARDIETRCDQHLAGVESTIRIARDDSLPESVWRKLLRDIRKQFPQTSVSIYSAPPQELEEMVTQNLVDVAYGLIPETHQLSRLNQIDLGQIRVMSVAHKDHPLSQLRKVTTADLERFTEIAVAYIDEESLKIVTPKAGKYIALSFYEHLRDAVLDQTGWSYLPAILINQYLREGTLKVLKYNRAMNWQAYGEVVESESRRTPVIKWLSDQIETYLFDESD
ncbi:MULTISPECIES: LysR family transcriptional regulator [unclassified Photobacterium]|uniref:LysR family transcriptional regulator n=1 Tax=unclassified Photobacterium TaxID=2628852 RepID=UPI001EDE9531|nr:MULTISPECIES: LysR family transcriptional regulator [unclassified Photobacterium]MCG3864230.1 LysR family transcriptional regulator [Photobacterium sp. Ph6]MCG3875800.1 LysR family transcriptional regulator [Photobacterium sp. Ph5]